MSQCPVCIENLTKKNTVACHIASCAYTACKTCVQTYLLNTLQEPHCMNCRNKWNQDFVKTSLGNTFIASTYRTHRANILADQMISKKEEHIENALLFKEQQIDKTLCSNLNIETANLRALYQKKYAELETVRKRINDREYRMQLRNHEEPVKEKKTKKTFLMPCQTDSCRGMLDSNYFCLLCAKTTCKSCLQSMEPNHECNPDNIASANFIKASSKPCPKCATRISKIDGCDQMWCIECKTAFSWNKGTIEEGVIHNPHYYQWMREHGAAIPRADNNNNCLNLDDSLNCLYRLSNLYHSSCKLNTMYENWTDVKQIYNFIKSHKPLFEKINGISNIISQYNRYRDHIVQTSLRELRTDIERKNENLDNVYGYIIGEKSREELGNSLVAKEINEMKQRAFIDILNATQTVLSQILQTINDSLHNLPSKPINYANRITTRNDLTVHDAMWNSNDKLIQRLYEIIKHDHEQFTIINILNNIVTATTEPIRQANKYLAYSNVEQIKMLIMHNSKKRIEIWNFDECQFQGITYSSKTRMTDDIAKFTAYM